MKDATMQHRSALVALGLVGLGLAQPAAAAPYVGESRQASTQVRLVGTDGKQYEVTLSVFVTSQAASAQTREVGLTIARCLDSGCGPALAFSRVASPTELSVSADNAVITLNTAFGGSPLRAAWQFGGSPADATNSVTNVTNGGATIGLRATGSVTVTVLAASCTDPVGSSDTVVAAHAAGLTGGGGAWPSKPPAGFAPKRGHRVTCAHAAPS
jgi:hypothetical protein